MAGTQLVEDQVHEGATLVKQLDADGLSPTLGAWYYYDDADEWRLLIASPVLDKLLPRNEALAYKRVAESIKSAGPLSLGLSDLKLIRTDADLARAIGWLIHTGEGGTTNARFSNTTLNGIFIPEMVVLRSAPATQKDQNR